jgi:hypothetical protein
MCLFKYIYIEGDGEDEDGIKESKKEKKDRIIKEKKEKEISEKKEKEIMIKKEKEIEIKLKKEKILEVFL